MGVDSSVCGHCRKPLTGVYIPRIAQVRGWSLRTDWEPVVTRLRDGLLTDIRREAKHRPAPQRRKAKKGSGHLLEISPVDLHVGKLSWAQETGVDYDVTIAEKVFTSAVSDLLERASVYPLDEIVLVVGNDLLQTDNIEGTTTSGTYVDTDTRYIRAFRRARSITSWAIRECAALAPVRVVIVPGNHDALTAFHVGEVLDAEFDNDPRVTVDASPSPRKYYRYGKTLLGWTHGNEEKHSDLPLIMAQECPKDWAETTHREFHTGHLHKMKETRFTAGDSFNGVRVRILPSLCAADAWHHKKGFVKEQRACEGYLWSRTHGYAGHLSSNVGP